MPKRIIWRDFKWAWEQLQAHFSSAVGMRKLCKKEGIAKSYKYKDTTRLRYSQADVLSLKLTLDTQKKATLSLQDAAEKYKVKARNLLSALKTYNYKAVYRMGCGVYLYKISEIEEAITLEQL